MRSQGRSAAVYHLTAILTVMIWGTTFISTKVLLGYGLTPAEILFYRFSLAYLGIWIFCPRTLFARNLRDELLLAAGGLCGGSLYFMTENTALGITLASNVSLILCTTPILTAFLARLAYRGEPLKRTLAYGSCMALGGVALVVFNGSFILNIHPAGDLLTLAAALMWACYGLILKRLDTRYPVLFVTRKVFFYGLLSLLPVFPFDPLRTPPEVLLRPAVLSNLLFLGAVASMLCYILWNTTVKKLGVVATTNYIYIVPLVTLVTSSLVLGEIITTVALAGCILILSGVYIAEKGFVLPFPGKRKARSF